MHSAAEALRPERQRVYPVGTERNWQADFDAQRLRADTAEAERDALRTSKEAVEFNLNKVDRVLLAAEQRIAELKAVLERMLEDDDMPVHWFAQRIDAALNPKPEAEGHE